MLQLFCSNKITQVIFMSSQALQKFKDQISQSSNLQEKIDSIQSPVELILLAKAIGIELTEDDLK